MTLANALTLLDALLADRLALCYPPDDARAAYLRDYAGNLRASIGRARSHE